MKEMDSTNSAFSKILPPSPLIITCITWNLFAAVPPIESLTALMKSATTIASKQPDAILIGTQECQRTLGASFFCQAKDQWEEMLTSVLTPLGYTSAAAHFMRGLHSIVFVQNHLLGSVEVHSTQKLRAGTCNLMGNKGAISLQISINSHCIQFINCHLAPHQTESEHRNATIHRILNEMVSPDQSTSIIFLGDFNYRIQMNKKQYQTLIHSKQNNNITMQYTSMIQQQQLRNQSELKTSFLPFYSEGEISFPPTYKISPNSDLYNNQRIPGWTDRIFHRIASFIQRKQYKCEYEIMGSDHRPVLASYEIKESGGGTEAKGLIKVEFGRTCSLI